MSLKAFNALVDEATAEFVRRHPRRNPNTITALHQIAAIARQIKAARS